MRSIPPADADSTDTLPTLSREAAADPDGDAVQYDVYLDTETEPAAMAASGLTETEFTPEESLLLAAACKDGNNITNNPPPPEEPENRAPSVFAVTVDTTGLDPVLTWTVATDPDGDPVTYTVLLEGEEVQTGLSDTTAMLKRLEYELNFRAG